MSDVVCRYGNEHVHGIECMTCYVEALKRERDALRAQLAAAEAREAGLRAAAEALLPRCHVTACNAPATHAREWPPSREDDPTEFCAAHAVGRGPTYVNPLVQRLADALAAAPGGREGSG